MNQLVIRWVCQNTLNLALNRRKSSLSENMDRLGHKDNDTTEQAYLHVTKTRKKEASQKFDELLRNL